MFRAISRRRILLGIPEVGERYMRREFPPLQLEASPAQGRFDLPLQMGKGVVLFHAGPQRCRALVAEKPRALQAHVERRRLNRRQDVDGGAEAVAIRLSNKSERQVKVLNRAPARALNTVLKNGERVGDNFRKREGDEEA